jgi:uncharacterized protein (TIGR02118 family)
MSRDEFQTYWRETHAPLVAQHAGALGIRRYVQVHTRGTMLDVGLRKSRGGPEPYDGIAELWYESESAIAESLKTPEGIAAGRTLLEDERRFIDLARSPLWLGQEHVIVGDDKFSSLWLDRSRVSHRNDSGSRRRPRA